MKAKTEMWLRQEHNGVEFLIMCVFSFDVSLGASDCFRINNHTRIEPHYLTGSHGSPIIPAVKLRFSRDVRGEEVFGYDYVISPRPNVDVSDNVKEVVLFHGETIHAEYVDAENRALIIQISMFSDWSIIHEPPKHFEGTDFIPRDGEVLLEDKKGWKYPVKRELVAEVISYEWWGVFFTTTSVEKKIPLEGRWGHLNTRELLEPVRAPIHAQSN